MKVSFNLNGNRVTIKAPPMKRLQDILCDSFSLTSLKKGCRIGECGTCLILMNGELFNSCLIPVFRARNKKILTFEGLIKEKLFSEIVEVFSEKNILHSDFCGSSLMLSSYVLLSRTDRPTEGEISEALADDSCRCNKLPSLIEAISRIGSTRKGR